MGQCQELKPMPLQTVPTETLCQLSRVRYKSGTLCQLSRVNYLEAPHKEDVELNFLLWLHGVQTRY